MKDWLSYEKLTCGNPWSGYARPEGAALPQKISALKIPMVWWSRLYIRALSVQKKYRIHFIMVIYRKKFVGNVNLKSLQYLLLLLLHPVIIFARKKVEMVACTAAAVMVAAVQPATTIAAVGVEPLGTEKRTFTSFQRFAFFLKLSWFWCQWYRWLFHWDRK